MMSMAANCNQQWWRNQMETPPALLALCAGNSPVNDEFPSQSPVTRSFDNLFDLGLNKRLSKQSRRWGFEMTSRSLWRHCNHNTRSQQNGQHFTHDLRIFTGNHRYAALVQKEIQCQLYWSNVACHKISAYNLMESAGITSENLVPWVWALVVP